MSDNDEPCMCGTPFTCMADDHDRAIARIQERIDETVEEIAVGTRRIMWRVG